LREPISSVAQLLDLPHSNFYQYELGSLPGRFHPLPIALWKSPAHKYRRRRGNGVRGQRQNLADDLVRLRERLGMNCKPFERKRAIPQEECPGDLF
jgi:hypothetical protein